MHKSRWGLVACLTLELVALGVWVGGLLVLIGAVIPAVFNTFGGQDAGGVFLTRTFEGYNHFVLGAMTILSAATWYRWWSGDTAVTVSRGETLVLLLMIVIAGIIMVGLHPYAASLQSHAFATKDEGARKAALEEFFRVHMPIRSLYMVNLVLGLVLLGMKAKRSLRGEDVQA